MRVANGVISTSDGQGTTRNLPMPELQRVVVATDDSGPCGDDFVFLLYAADPDPVGVFPLEANGRADFVDWLSRQPPARLFRRGNAESLRLNPRGEVHRLSARVAFLRMSAFHP